MNKLIVYLALLLLVNATATDLFAQKKTKVKSNNRSIRQQLSLIEASDGEAILVKGEMTKFPPAFDGHDIVVLFNNLKYYLSQKTQTNTNQNLQNFLKGKALAGNLTTDDLFVFTKDSDKQLYAQDKNNKKMIYQAELYRLKNKNEPPVPQLGQTYQCGGVGPSDSEKIPTVSSKDELIKSVQLIVNSNEFWQNVVLPLKTELLQSNPRNYRGHNLGGGCKTYIYSPQYHYQLAFNNEQPFELFETKSTNFSYQTYEYLKDTGAGLAAWLHDKEDPSSNSYLSNLNSMLVFRLAPPYISSEEIKTFDKFERKMHRDIVNRVYVDLIDIWVYSKNTGLIISKQKSNKL